MKTLTRLSAFPTTVGEACQREVQSCAPETTLAAAARMMEMCDTGTLPVVNGEGALVGSTSLREIAIAVAAHGRPAADTTVAELPPGPARCCTTGTSLREALELMRTWAARRLWVVDAHGQLVGVLTIEDVILTLRDTQGRRPAPTYEDVMIALMATGPEEDRPPGPSPLAD